MNCWICGALADSKEHLFKRSDLVAAFGRFDQRRPLYMHSIDSSNVPVKGPNADILKMEPVICQSCNNALSAPYDRAWEAMVSYLLEQNVHGYLPSRLQLARVYGNSALDIADGLARLQLYAIKHGGCVIAEADPNCPLLTSFAAHLKSGQPHPNVFLRFAWLADVGQAHEIVQMTQVEAFTAERGIAYLTWAYRLRHAFVQVYYCRARSEVVPLVSHPEDGARLIAFQSVVDVSEGLTHFRPVRSHTN
jgi:hypothetical protein